MDRWQIIPNPQRVTELYYTHYQQLPVSLIAGAEQELTFSVHNLEHRTTTYHYKLVAASPNNTSERLLGNGTFTLASAKLLVTSRTIVVPALGSRIALKVDLEYEGLAPGSDTSSLQTQSIHYWATVTNPSVGNQEKHETS